MQTLLDLYSLAVRLSPSSSMNYRGVGIKSRALGSVPNRSHLSGFSMRSLSGRSPGTQMTWLGLSADCRQLFRKILAVKLPYAIVIQIGNLLDVGASDGFLPTRD